MLRLAEAAGVRLRTQRCSKREDRVCVDQVHLAALLSPVFNVILQNAERVDPYVSEAEGVGE